MGLMFNAILKIPMQFFILFVGVMVYVFYIFHTPPIHFNDQSLVVIRESLAHDQFIAIENSYNDLILERKNLTLSYTEECSTIKKLQLKNDLINILRISKKKLKRNGRIIIVHHPLKSILKKNLVN